MKRWIIASLVTTLLGACAVTPVDYPYEHGYYVHPGYYGRDGYYYRDGYYGDGYAYYRDRDRYYYYRNGAFNDHGK